MKKSLNLWINGGILVVLAVLGFLNTRLAGEDATKYISPVALWWTNTVCGIIGAGLIALKGFLSTAYADHKHNKQQNEKLSSQ